MATISTRKTPSATEPWDIVRTFQRLPEATRRQLFATVPDAPIHPAVRGTLSAHLSTAKAA